jgi:hypothetical protein
MFKIIKDQLNKCKVANIPLYDEGTTEILIPKGGKAVIKDDLILNKCYKIAVEDYIVKPYEGFTLHDNWNKGIAPKDKIMNCEIVQIMGKMIKVEAVGVDTNNTWSGWLPRKAMHILEEL